MNSNKLLKSNFISTSLFCSRDEFDFIPAIEPVVNKSPFLVIDHKLGIEAWAIKIIFSYAHEKMIEIRKSTNTLGEFT